VSVAQRNFLTRVLCILLAVTSVVAGTARAEEKARSPSVANGVEPVILDEPAFPEALVRDRMRLWTGAFFAPGADFGSQDVSLYRPELRLRYRFPIDDVVSLQVTGDFRASLYDGDGSDPLFADCPDCPLPDDLYMAGIGTQGGYVINHGWHLFRDDEQWAVLGALFLRARWEPGVFSDSITPGGSIGLGYDLTKTFRIALGARIERALDGDGVKVAPSGFLRWDITPHLRLRDRDLGLELEYRPSGRWELFVTGFQSSDSFLLDDRPGLSSSPTFRDAQVLVGGGLVFKVAHFLRLSLETGAIFDRTLSVKTVDDGKLDSADGDVSPYATLRIEFRP
jgi:hypothetical protein